MSRTPVTDEIRYLIRHLKARAVSVRNLSNTLGTTPETLRNIQAGKYKSCPEALYRKIYEAADRYGIAHLPVETAPDAVTDPEKGFHSDGELGAVGDDLTDPDSDPEITVEPPAEDEDSYDPLFNSLIVAWNRIRTEAGRCGLVALAYQIAADSGKEV